MNSNSINCHRAQHRAFTLIEIILVLSIIALLLGVGIANLDKFFGGGQRVRARADISTFATALKSYLTDTGKYPSQEQGLGTLQRAPLTGSESRAWAGPYMEVMPLDPWGAPYQYRFPGTRNPQGPDVFCSGKDGVADTADDIWPEAGAGDGAY